MKHELCRPVTSLEYRLKASELRRLADAFESPAARRRANLIAEELERRAGVWEPTEPHFDDLH